MTTERPTKKKGIFSYGRKKKAMPIPPLMPEAGKCGLIYYLKADPNS
jgi:hypothetical protein